MPRLGIDERDQPARRPHPAAQPIGSDLSQSEVPLSASFVDLRALITLAVLSGTVSCTAAEVARLSRDPRNRPLPLHSGSSLALRLHSLLPIGQCAVWTAEAQVVWWIDRPNGPPDSSPRCFPWRRAH